MKKPELRLLRQPISNDECDQLTHHMLLAEGHLNAIRDRLGPIAYAEHYNTLNAALGKIIGMRMQLGRELGYQSLAYYYAWFAHAYQSTFPPELYERASGGRTEEEGGPTVFIDQPPCAPAREEGHTMTIHR